MEAFEFSYFNRPRTIDKKILNNADNSLRQNGKVTNCIITYHSYIFYMIASQMWLLGRLLPCMIGCHIPEDDEKWLNFLLLLQIVDIFAPVISEDEVAFLQVLIQQHHETFAVLYPEKSITLKMHYMIHMARIILL